MDWESNGSRIAIEGQYVKCVVRPFKGQYKLIVSPKPVTPKFKSLKVSTWQSIATRLDTESTLWETGEDAMEAGEKAFAEITEQQEQVARLDK